MRYLFSFLFLLFTTFLSFAQYSNEYDSKTSSREFERIKHFHSDIVIHKDGDITVTENITIYANHLNINRGIVRSLPYYFENQLGNKRGIKTKIISVKRNGKDEPYEQDIFKDGRLGARELLLGDDTYLDIGTHTYQITYKMSAQVFHYEGFDELYWNVTGNDWDFQIDSASATIILPDTEALNTACYTGRMGSKARNCTMSVEGNKVTFFSNKVLRNNEGFTVAVSFPEGILERSAWLKIEELWNRYAQTIFAIVSVILLSLYYLITWSKYGRQGVKPTVIPTFEPPRGWSPAEVQFLDKLKVKDSVLGTTLISMAVKGAIRIESVKKKYTLKKVDENRHKLKDEELLVYDTLFGSNRATLNLSGKYIPKLNTAINKLSSSLQKKHDTKDLKKKGYSFLVMGALFAILGLNLYFFADDYNYNLRSYIMPLGLLVSVIVGIIWHHKTKDGKVTFMSCLFAIGYFIFWLVWFFVSVATLIRVIYSLFFSLDAFNTMSIAFVLFVILSYFLYCKNFNLKPQKRLDLEAELAGFKLYLKTAEEHRLNMLMTPEHSLDLYERMLPYAIALGVENAWNKKFQKELDLANYNPDWYSGDRPFRSRRSNFASSLNSSVSRSSYDRSSSSSSGGGSRSSGSRGGGSSGGGRGGGGGRGR